MTTVTERVPAGHYRFRHVARMEWIKLRTMRSTWWTLVVTAAAGAAMAVAIGLNTISRSADLTNNVLAGVIPGLLLIGVLGVLIDDRGVLLGDDPGDAGRDPPPAAAARREGRGVRRRGSRGRRGRRLPGLLRRRGRLPARRIGAHAEPVGRAPGDACWAGRATA